MDAETPLVRRTVRSGGVLLAVAAAQFVAVLTLVADRYSGFNLWTSTVTSLGTAAFPWGLAFSASLLVLGVLAAFGLLFSWSAFDERSTRGVGLFALLAASFAVAVLGVFLLLGSRVPSTAAPVAGFVAIVLAGLGLVIVAFAMHQHERWRISRAYTLASGIVVLAGAGLYAAHALVGFGHGGIERLLLSAVLLWAIVEGLHIALLHRFAPPLQVKVAAA